MLLFVYGTLKCGYGNHHYLKDFTFVGNTKVAPYKMYNVGSFPCIVRTYGENAGYDEVNGEVYSMPAIDWIKARAPLDRLEGVPHLYDRTQVLVCIDGKYKSAEAYIWNRPLDGLKQISSGTW